MRDGLIRAGRALVDLYPKGLSLFWLAPAVMGLVVIPEFLQHVVEIRLGMFDSREAFDAAYATELGRHVAADSMAHVRSRTRMFVVEHPVVG